jgi:hypothetical protein
LKRQCGFDSTAPLWLAVVGRVAPDPISKRKKKIQTSDFFGFVSFPLLLICLNAALEASADYEEDDVCWRELSPC